ncbi:hypothetical protein DYB37_006083 [Aphanomyces astaci]|uniref:Uncharacterized protein n=3 Tax=Aphanomyces astaci TaxID=112090 RepID=A0A397BND7_APHAT|nr:hypothetical protein DYB25_000732 [Aphanomyces astaci]RHY96516.1 hypothetical protein DYB35_002748 [Aphanomyces astaci]RHZ26111.1 hypothetical protein DYB37_006083 [Aphanomyces astaci]RLO12052.1 hypothetical protein DYB28_011679 [Aphanomyces astaci]
MASALDSRYEEHNNDHENNDDIALVESSEPLTEPADADCPPKVTKKTVQDRLAAALREIDDQRRLLEAAASNGSLLAEKYFALEVEHDVLSAKYSDARQHIEELESQQKFNQHRATSVQKCIDLEQQLNTHLREQEAQDETRERQDAEIQHWRAKAASAAKDNALLRDLVATLEADKADAVQSCQHIAQANRKVQSERSELATQVKELEGRLNDQADREQRLVLSHDIKLQKIQRLEATVEALEEAVRTATDKLVKSEKAAKLHEDSAKELRGVVNGLKRSLSSLQQDYQLVVDTHAIETQYVENHATPNELSGWDHFLLALASIKECLVGMTHNLTRSFQPLR